MPLTKEKRKLNKLIEDSDSEGSEHELSYYVNDRIKLMKEVLKIVKPKKIRDMAPSCLRDVDPEELNSMLLEELLGISNKRLKYIFSGQSLDEDSSSTTSEDEPIDIISLDDISDDELVINVDDDEEVSQQKKNKKESKHHKCKRAKHKRSIKLEEEHHDKKLSEEQQGIGSNKNLMSVLELLELQARARAIKSQLLLENAKTQESIALSKIPTLEEKVGSDDEVIIKTAKTEEIVITSSDSENECLQKDVGKINDKVDTENTENISENVASNESVDSTINSITQNMEADKTQNIKIIENKELCGSKPETNEDNDSNSIKITDTIRNESGGEAKNEKEKSSDDGIIQINLSDDEMNELK